MNPKESKVTYSATIIMNGNQFQGQLKYLGLVLSQKP